MLFVERNKNYPTKKSVIAEYPSKIVVAVCGGWGVFDTLTDYHVWKIKSKSKNG